MAKELPKEGIDFGVEVEWPTAAPKGGDAIVDQSVGDLSMTVAGVFATEFQEDSGRRGETVRVPLYGMAEWLAENWWSLLYEPRKTDTSVDADYRSRHWLGWARSGVALPSVMFTPVGPGIEVWTRESHLRFAKATFLNDASAVVPTERVEAELRKFVTAILERLSSHGVSKTDAHSAWKRINNTAPDEVLYCKLIGSMGLSPYVPHPEIDDTLDRISDHLSPAMLADLCNVADMASIKRIAAIADEVATSFSSAPIAHIDALAAAQVPKDVGAHGWQWGRAAVSTARDTLGIGTDDVEGANHFFQMMGLPIESAVASDTRVGGGMQRDGDEIRLSIGSELTPQRKFNAARGIFLGWIGDQHDSRLITTAKTRDQQASKAFAAELLAPRAYLKKVLGDAREVSSFRIEKIAEDIEAPTSVVLHQAANAHYEIFDAAY